MLLFTYCWFYFAKDEKAVACFVHDMASHFFPLLLGVVCFHFTYVSISQTLLKNTILANLSPNTCFYGRIASGDYKGYEKIRCRYTQIKRATKLILTKMHLEKGLHICYRLPYICNQSASSFKETESSLTSRRSLSNWF